MKIIRTLLVDDHAIVRMGYKALLETACDIEVVGEAATGEMACRRYVELSPHVVIMDISLPGMGGLDAARRLLQRDAAAKLLMFSMHEETVFVEKALQAGALGYVTKSSAPDVLVDAVRVVANGNIYLEPLLAETLATRKMQSNVSPMETLSPREFEIFRLLASGSDVNETAQRLSLSYKTVANYSTQLKTKLHARTSADLARIAIRFGIIQP